MIKCNLSTLMGMKKLKISDVEKETGIHRNKIAALYKETAIKVDLDTLDKLCVYFKCDVSDLLERVENHKF